MAAWVVRGGALGERETLAFEANLAIIGWEELGDLSGVRSRDELQTICQETYPGEKRRTLSSWIGQIWSFLKRIEVGDVVILPLHGQSTVAVGRIAGPYEYRPDLPADSRHVRRVTWESKDSARSVFDEDIRYSFGALGTVRQVQRDNAEARIWAALARQQPPEPPEGPERGLEIDLEDHADEQIRTHIGEKFRGHGLAKLVTGLLASQGYHTEMSPPGPDGGVDIVAGRGPLGFDPPRLCVQVKSSDSPVDVHTLREFQGVIQRFGAQQGLFVAWGGYRQTVRNEARAQFFGIRLWDAADLVREILLHYEDLPKELQADLPLKRIWILVTEDQT